MYSGLPVAVVLTMACGEQMKLTQINHHHHESNCVGGVDRNDFTKGTPTGTALRHRRDCRMHWMICCHQAESLKRI